MSYRLTKPYISLNITITPLSDEHRLLRCYVILVTLLMEAISSSDTSVLMRATRRNVPENGNLHIHRHEKRQILHSVNWLDFVAET
jgi:hypothetical protein